MILNALYRVATDESGTPKVWLALARKLEGVDKQVIVRTLR